MGTAESPVPVIVIIIVTVTDLTMPFGNPAAQSTTRIAALVARDIRHERGGRTVLNGVSLAIGPTTRLGVVGPNGVGKSTLLQILAGILIPASGDVRVDPPTATIGYLSQERPKDPQSQVTQQSEVSHKSQLSHVTKASGEHAIRAAESETVRELLARRTGVAAAEKELIRTATGLGVGGAGADERYAVALARFESLTGGDFEARLVATFDQVGLLAELADQSVASLSGGQEARVALAAILMARFDIMLLDEPTNDLDFDGLEHLEQMISRRRGALAIVSHDRAFLDRVVTDVLELDEHSHTGRLYGGGWAGYLAEREADRLHAAEAYATYEAKRADLRRRAQRERQWATSGVAREKKRPGDNDKMQRDFRINRTEKQAARARRTERALEALEPVEKPWEGWDLRFTISETGRSGAVVCRLEDAVLERGGFILGPLTLDIAWADRVALVGENGTGKTTLVEAILGRLPLAAGTRRLGPSVIVGELGQDRRVLGPASDVVSAFISATGSTTQGARSQLAKFGLGADAVSRPTSSLSPGERTRAELAVFAASGVNFLVLDEPTNHLDLPGIEQLESALNGYRGTLLLVSHDRRLLETLQFTRHILLPDRSGVFRGLREER